MKTVQKYHFYKNLCHGMYCIAVLCFLACAGFADATNQFAMIGFCISGAIFWLLGYVAEKHSLFFEDILRRRQMRERQRIAIMEGDYSEYVA